MTAALIGSPSLFLALLLALVPSLAHANAATVPPIPNIVVTGSSIRAAIDPVISSYVGRPETEPVVKSLADQLDGIYAGSGIAVYTIGVTQATGVLHVEIREGYVETITVSGETSAKGASRIRELAEGLREETPLRKVTLQRTLQLIAATPGFVVTADMTRGQKPDALAVNLTIKRKPPTIALSLNNYGNRVLGRTRLGGVGSLGNILTGGDQLNVAAYASLGTSAYRALSASYALPIGRDGLAATGSFTHGTTRVAALQLEGTVNAQDLTLSYPLILESARTLLPTLSFNRTSSRLSYYGEPLLLDRTRAVRLGMSYSSSSDRLATSFNLSLSRGLNIDGAQTNRISGQTQFTKLNASFGIDKVLGRRFVTRLRGQAQLSGDRLVSAESITAGGMPFGRAFDESIIGGDSGVEGSVEVAWMGHSQNEAKRVELYSGVDGATLRQHERSPYVAADYSLASGFVGVRTNIAKLDIDATAAKSLVRPFAGADADWRLLLGCQLHLGG